MNITRRRQKWRHAVKTKKPQNNKMPKIQNFT